MKSVRETARELAKLGPVFPVHGKRPLWMRWPDRAKREVDGAAEWDRATGVGFATGARAGFFVVDVDPAKGGEESLITLEAEHGPLPKTLTVRTGGGGLHFYFAMPDFPIRNSAGTK